MGVASTVGAFRYAGPSPISHEPIPCGYGRCRHGPLAPATPWIRRRRRGTALRPGRPAAEHDPAAADPADPGAGADARRPAVRPDRPGSAADRGRRRLPRTRPPGARPARGRSGRDPPRGRRADRDPADRVHRDRGVRRTRRLPHHGREAHAGGDRRNSPSWSARRSSRRWRTWRSTSASSGRRSRPQFESVLVHSEDLVLAVPADHPLAVGDAPVDAGRRRPTTTSATARRVRSTCTTSARR